MGTNSFLVEENPGIDLFDFTTTDEDVLTWV